MLCLNKFFKVGIERYEYALWTAEIGDYTINLWLGSSYSDPCDKRLKPDDYTNVSFRVSCKDGQSLKKQDMNDLFGYNLLDYSCSGKHGSYADEGYNIPIEVLCNMVRKLIALNFPADAGDGE